MTIRSVLGEWDGEMINFVFLYRRQKHHHRPPLGPLWWCCVELLSFLRHVSALQKKKCGEICRTRVVIAHEQQPQGEKSQ